MEHVTGDRFPALKLHLERRDGTNQETKLMMEIQVIIMCLVLLLTVFLLEYFINYKHFDYLPKNSFSRNQKKNNTKDS